MSIVMAWAFSLSVANSAAWATTYYVSTEPFVCNDLNNGLTPEKPFCTVEKCVSEALAGDTCRLRSGIYRERVAPRSGVSFEVEPGHSATISGAVPVTQFTQDPELPNIWRAPVPDPPASCIAESEQTDLQVFVDGEMITEARWPNADLDPMEPNLARADDGTGATNGGSSWQLVEASLPTPPSGESWDGASVHIAGGFAWTTYTLTVGTGASGSTLPLLGLPSPPPPDAANYFPKPRNKYYISGKRWLLDRPGEWFAEDGDLYVWLPDSGSPAGHQVEIKRCRTAFELTTKNYVSLSGLSLFATSINTNDLSHHIGIQNVTASYLNHYASNPWTGNPWGPHDTSGVVIEGSSNTVSNSSFTYSAGNGLMVGGASFDPGQTIVGNLILNANYQGTAAAPISFVPPANLNGEPGTSFQWNSIRRSGRDGIRVGGVWLKNHEISHNEIQDTGLLTQDHGGIYIPGATSVDPNDALQTAVRIRHNRVHDIQAKTDGGVGAHDGAGLYLDIGASNILLHHNVVWNAAGDGLRLNGDGASHSFSKSNRAYFNTIGCGQNTIGCGQERSVGSCCASAFNHTRLIGNIFTGPVDEIIRINTDFGENLETEPLFVDPGAANYLLQSNSPAINAVDDPNYPTPQLPPYPEGCTPSGYPDQGAYEYGSGYPCNWAAGCNIGGCFGRVSDDIRDWGRTLSHTPTLSITADQEAINFWGDESRVGGSGAGTKEIVWKQYGLESVSVTVFAGPNAVEPFVTFATSVDGSNWSSRLAQWRQTGTIGTWQRRVYTIFNVGSASFIRLQWTGDAETAIQIGSATLTYLAWPARLLSDPLEPSNNQFFRSLSSVVHGSTPQWPQPPGELNFDTGYIFGDTWRLYRTTIGAAHVVWKHPGMHSFLATVYHYVHPPPHVDKALVVEASFDGQVWRKIDVSLVVRAIPQSPGWQEHTYFADRLTNVNFVKMRWESSLFNWAPQIGGVRIIH